MVLDFGHIDSLNSVREDGYLMVIAEALNQSSSNHWCSCMMINVTGNKGNLHFSLPISAKGQQEQDYFCEPRFLISTTVARLNPSSLAISVIPTNNTIGQMLHF